MSEGPLSESASGRGAGAAGPAGTGAGEGRDPWRQWPGRVVLVTGAAGGLGLALVRGFRDRGATVVLADVDGAGLARAVAATGGDDGLVHAATVDVTDVVAVRSLVAAVDRRHGRLDVLVNNAGIQRYAPLEDVTEALYDRVMGVNVRGAFFLSQAAVPLMRRRGWGRVVNISSVSAHTGSRIESPQEGEAWRADTAVYAAGKAALLAFTKAFARRYAAEGILCNAVTPARVLTPLVADLPPEQRARLAAAVPLGRWAQPEEVAEAFFWLAGDEASFVAGATLDVNGGLLMR